MFPNMKNATTRGTHTSDAQNARLVFTEKDRLHTTVEPKGSPEVAKQLLIFPKDTGLSGTI
jgi:hypothetical protein